MNRRTFIGGVGGTVAAAGAAMYLLSDKTNLSRADLRPAVGNRDLTPDENEILLLASLAPSGHNTQPWFVRRLEPFHWIVGNDKSRWLPAVDPTQRETILSIGAFLQNLEYAAGSLGYACKWNPLARSNQDEPVMEVELAASPKRAFDVAAITRRRTVRSGFSSDMLKKEDLHYLVTEPEGVYYLPAMGKESRFVNEQTIEANRLQAYRDPAQQELADWVRFSSRDARKHRDGLTTAGMEIEGIPGWMVRNFYGKNEVMKSDFRERGLDKVREEVSTSAGWILITSKDETVATLLDTGRRMQRLFLKVRDKSIALHPMTQILEEASTRETLNQSVGISDPVQFLLRVGYVDSYPSPVSLRRPVDWFVRK